MKKLYYLIVLTLILGLVLTGCTLLSNIGQAPATDQSGITYLTKGGPTEAEAESFPLYAGQDWEVGEVLVWNNDIQVCVKYVLDQDVFDAGWGLTETHLAIVTDPADVPQTKPKKGALYGNPKVGHFTYGDCELGEKNEAGPYCVFLKDLEVKCNETLFIAAHAVIKKTECGPLTEAPYGGFQVVNSLQGLRYDYTAVKTARSNPDTVLTFEVGHAESYFFSLGFNEDRSEYLPLDNAWIIVEFDKPIQNGPGDDLQLVEDTWGLPYPDETADVWVSQDGVNWKYLGEADNQNPVSSYHTVTNFDLDVVGLEWVKFVKVQNTSIRSDFAHLYPGQKATLDGYDLNAILALQDYQECTTYSESAWGAESEGEIRFVDKGNWATYFEYTVTCPENLCIDFTKLGLDPGDSIEGADTVYTGLEIDAVGGNAVVLMPGDVTAVTYGAPNGGGSIKNGCMDSTGGFADINKIHHYVFTFNGISVSEFSLHMLDFGDYNQDRVTHHLVTITAYSDMAGTVEVDTDVLDYSSDNLPNPRSSTEYGDLYYTGDACDAEEGEPGNWTWEVSGTGIVRIELEINEGCDPNIAFDNLCFTIEQH